MARKPHLAAMPTQELIEYQRRLRSEQASVIAELAMRERLPDPPPPEELPWGPPATATTS